MSLPPPFYDRAGITIYNADYRDVTTHINTSDVALVLTDPPYGISMNTTYSDRMHMSAPSEWAPVAGDNEKFDPGPILRFPRVVLWGANYYSDLLPVGSWLVWRKVGISPVLADCEMAWHNAGGKRVAYFESNHSATKATDGKLHPTQKPASLMRWVLDQYTKPGDLVFDPYMGSGPVAQAAYDLGRRYIGVELVEGYCAAAAGRLSQLSLLDGKAV